MNYCNGVQGFINFTTSIPITFTGCGIRCLYRKCQNKKYLHLDVVMMHLLVLATCMELQMTTVILTGIWLWMQ
jgi:hypothetical protein